MGGGTGENNNVILQELRMGLKHGDKNMELIQKHGDEKMEAIQEHVDEKMEAMMTVMQTHNAEEKEIIQKREDDKMEMVQKHEVMMLNEIHSLQTQLAVVMLTCVSVSV